MIGSILANRARADFREGEKMRTTELWAGVAAFALSTSAFATTVTVSWHSPLITPSPIDSVSWSGTSAAGSGSANAGRFNGTVTAFTAPLQAGDFVDSTSNFLAYCYDLLQTLHNGTYTVGSVNANTLNFLGAVDYVLNGNSNTWADINAWLHPSNGNIGAAIQVGIWKSLYETTGTWNLTTGDIHFSGLDAATAAEYALFRAAAENGSVNDLSSANAMALVSQDNQDVITGRRPRQQVPEPGSLLLLGLGAALAGWTARRKR